MPIGVLPFQGTLHFFPWRACAKSPSPSPLSSTPKSFSLALGDGHGHVVSGGQRGRKGFGEVSLTLGRCRWRSLRPLGSLSSAASPQSRLRVRLGPAPRGGQSQGLARQALLASGVLPEREQSSCSRPGGGRSASTEGSLLAVVWFHGPDPTGVRKASPTTTAPALPQHCPQLKVFAQAPLVT